MVVVTGPCMSLEARGTLNDTITYAMLGRTCYAKPHFTPANPRSPAQTGTRCMTKFLTQSWGTLPEFLHEKFIPLGKLWNTSPYHAFLAHNSRRWRSFQMPVGYYGFIGTVPFRTHELIVTDNHPHYSFEANIYSEPARTYCYQMNAADISDFTPARSNTILIVGNWSGNSTKWTFSGDWTYTGGWTPYFKGRYGNSSGQASAFIAGT